MYQARAAALLARKNMSIRADIRVARSLRLSWICDARNAARGSVVATNCRGVSRQPLSLRHFYKWHSSKVGIWIIATNGSLPCLQGRVRVGCERSERQEPNMASIHFLRKFSFTLKPKQPHPNPPPGSSPGQALLPQGREHIVASIKVYRPVTLLDDQASPSSHRLAVDAAEPSATAMPLYTDAFPPHPTVQSRVPHLPLKRATPT